MPGIWSRGREDDDGDAEEGDGADLHIATEVIARGEQQPDREGRGDEGVEADADGQGAAIKREPMLERGAREPLARIDGKEQRDDADKADDAEYRCVPAIVMHRDAHDEGDGHRGEDRRKPPGALRERLYHHETQHGDEDHQDGCRAAQGDEARRTAPPHHASSAPANGRRGAASRIG